MKKSFFAVMATLMLITMSVKASISGTLLPAISDSISWDKAALQTYASGYTGTYRHYYLWNIFGDTVVNTTSATLHNVAPISVTLSGLPAATSIVVKSVLVNGSDTFVTNSQTIFTKNVPVAARIGSVTVYPGPSQSLVVFNYDISFGISEKVTFLYGAYSYKSDSLVLTGAGVDTLHVTSPNVSGVTYTGNSFVAEPIISGIVLPTVVTVGPFTVPTWIAPSIPGITTGLITQDSFRCQASINKGNALSANVIIRDLDSNGAVLSTRASFPIWSDTTVTWFRKGLPGNRYGQEVSIASLGGADTMVIFERLSQVLPPQIMGFDTFNASLTGTDLVVQVKTNGRSYWPTSTAEVWLRWVNKDGIVFITTPQTTAGSTATATLTFTGLSNLKSNPSANSATIYIQNLAGLIDSQVVTFVVKPPHAAVPISTGWYLEAWSSFELRTWSINAGPSSDPYDLYAFVNVAGAGLVDTFLLRPNQVGYTDFIKKDTIGNRVGGTNYEVRLATRNIDGVWYVTGRQSTTTIPPADPTFFISNSVVTTETIVSYEVHGCMNGKARYLDVEIALPESVSSPIAVISHGYKGTGNFSATGTFSGLAACTDYVITAVTHDGSHGEENTETKSTNTKCYSTGIDEARETSISVFPNPATDQVTIKSNQPLGEITISSMDGKVVFNQMVSQDEITIQVADFASGFYAITGNGFVGKLIKQ